MRDARTVGAAGSAALARSAGAQASWRVALPLGLGVFLSMLPVTMMVPVLKEVVADRFAASLFWTHSFMSINMLGAIIAAPLGGILTDRLGRRKPILLTALLVDTGMMWGMAQAGSLQELFAFRFLEGMAHIVALTTLMAMATDWAPQQRRGRMMGLLGACMMFGTAIGSPIGGAIGRHAPERVFEFGALIAFAAAIVVMLGARDFAKRSTTASLAQLRGLLRSHRELSVPLAYAFIDRFCVGVLIATFMMYLSTVLQMDPPSRGMLMAYFMLPFAVLCYPVGRLIDRIGRVWPMALGSVGFGLVFASYGLWTQSWLPVAMVISGVLSAIMFSPNLALCADLAPSAHRATVFAAFNVAGSLGFLAGPLFGGALCAILLPRLGESVGYATVLALAGATEVLCAALTLPMLLRLRREGKTR